MSVSGPLACYALSLLCPDKFSAAVPAHVCSWPDEAGGRLCPYLPIVAGEERN